MGFKENAAGLPHQIFATDGIVRSEGRELEQQIREPYRGGSLDRNTALSVPYLF
jgi:hypothetical protein